MPNNMNLNPREYDKGNWIVFAQEVYQVVNDSQNYQRGVCQVIPEMSPIIWLKLSSLIRYHNNS
jgi:hypothetical protein